jgi:hypothetical protein
MNETIAWKRVQQAMKQNNSLRHYEKMVVTYGHLEQACLNFG